jgi:predicted amidohydrolase YtcJ
MVEDYGQSGSLLLRGKVITMAEDGLAEAVLTEGARIAGVGSFEELRERVRDETQILDLKGRTILPGFIDSHTHLVGMGLEETRLDLSCTDSLSGAMEMVSERVKDSSPKEVIIGVNWDESRWRERRVPAKEELDMIAPRNPLILRRICGHRAVANTQALALIGKGWRRVDRERGILLEDVCLNLDDIFPPSRDQLLSALKAAIRRAHREGVTSVQDMAKPSHLWAYQRLRQSGELKIRAYINLPFAQGRRLSDLGLETGFGDELIRLGGLKVFADGSIGAKTAALFSPYRRGRGKGLLLHSQEVLKKMVRKGEDGGHQLLIHAIGDRAIHQVLEAYEKGIVYPNPLRHRIEHFELAREEDMEEAKRLGLLLSMQPNFIGNWSKPGGMYEDRLPQCKENNRFGLIKEKGLRIALGSDCMPLSPLYGLRSVVEAPFPQQRVTIEDALRMYTLEPAYFSFEEGIKGSIKEGKLADLVVLSQDIFKEGMEGTEVDMTIWGGEIVYRRR